jgi:N-acetylglutamate synthase-like GNAT family acetyltransferase
MTMPNQQVRRATVEDVSKLVHLWQQENLPSQNLEKRFKEFQVVEGPNGELLGAIGFQIIGQEALLHSEAFLLPEHAEFVREKVWERAQIMAKNHGLVRVWTQFNAPFWRGNGFQHPREEALQKLPAGFSATESPWLMIQLREDTAPAVSLDKEFAMFKEAEREQTERMFRQAKVLKFIAVGIALLVAVMVIVWAVYFLMVQRKISKRHAALPVVSERAFAYNRCSAMAAGEKSSA